MSDLEIFNEFLRAVADAQVGIRQKVVNVQKVLDSIKNKHNKPDET